MPHTLPRRRPIGLPPAAVLAALVARVVAVLDGFGQSDLVVAIVLVRVHIGGNGKTEVHVLNGADGDPSFLTHQATSLHQTGISHAWKLLVANP
ncbi:hypothetical protein [Xanthomonas medicagonis]|uniref:hypothetical protein n=1 Tax=Xanthomonas medicagonis TaxID=3160841 RepID=UPI00351323A2